MIPQKKANNEDKLAYLVNLFKEQKEKQDKLFKIYFSIFIVRFGAKTEVVHREPVSEKIREQVEMYASKDKFNPDFIIVDLFSGRSHNVRTALATFKFNYTNARK